LLALASFVVGGASLAFRQGLVPAALSPLLLIDLAEPDAWFVDWRLAELKTDRALCQRVLRAPFIDAQPIADQPLADGCGWRNAVKFSSLSGAKLSTDKLSCPSAAGLTLWVTHDIQPLARELLGSPVLAIKQFGTYSCRNVMGSPLFKHWRSAHATANAIDIAGFTLADGRQITVKKDWKGTGREAEFLRAIRQRACRYFHVAIGPDYNAAHHDHFHLDRGVGHACR
jgi:hypothetical protein